MVKYLLRVQVARVRFPPKPSFLRKKVIKRKKGKRSNNKKEVMKKKSSVIGIRRLCS